MKLSRRKAIASGLSTVAVASTGVYAATRGASATVVGIGSTDPSVVKNDRGDLESVKIDPQFRVEWQDFDEPVGKVFFVVEANPANQGWSPLFRSTPWLTEASKNLDGQDLSKPGTTGYFELTKPLSDVLLNSAYARDSTDEDPRDPGRALSVVDTEGRPDYASADGVSPGFDDIGGVDSASYLGGGSVGSADDAAIYLDEKDSGSSLPLEKGLLPLVNNYPGAESGYYGAASDTLPFDNPDDGTVKTTQVTLRYTFALLSPNDSFIQWGSDDPVGEGWFSNLREDNLNYSGHSDSDVQQDSQGNSVLVQNDEDGYPNLADGPGGSAASNNYDGLQQIASDHPAVFFNEVTFDVDVENEQATLTPNGDTNPTSSGAGQ
jgi:hypothetical protein